VREKWNQTNSNSRRKLVTNNKNTMNRKEEQKMKEPEQLKELPCPKAGTATYSRYCNTVSVNCKHNSMDEKEARTGKYEIAHQPDSYC